ncbi:MAG: response regulator, partial [Calditrichota bacterium]
FPTDFVVKGTGLGLSVVYGIMQSHKGFVEVESELNEGTTFYLYFPPAKEKSLVELPTDVNKLPKGDEVILIVDDEKMIRESVKDILESLGYKVMQASSGSDAIHVVQKNNSKIQIAIVDMSMPKMGGIETIRKIREVDKNIKILLSSGHLEKEKLIPDDLNLEGVLPKPYRMSDLAHKIRQILG